MLAFYVMKIFKQQDEDRASLDGMTRAARLHAQQLFDRRENAENMLGIYEQVAQRRKS